MKRVSQKAARILPVLIGLVGLVIFAIWWKSGSSDLKPRVPGTDDAPGGEGGGTNPVFAGKLVPGSARTAELPGAWPQFRGPNRDGMALGVTEISRDWKTSPPRETWSLDVGEGYAGVAVRAGRVYLLDYDRDAKQSSLRCLALADGMEIWRYTYPLTIKRNHGMTRTVPTVTDHYVIALDSKCNVFCAAPV